MKIEARNSDLGYSKYPMNTQACRNSLNWKLRKALVREHSQDQSHSFSRKMCKQIIFVVYNIVTCYVSMRYTDAGIKKKLYIRAPAQTHPCTCTCTCAKMLIKEFLND